MSKATRPVPTNPFEIRGKVILVTGGTRGLGRAIAFQLAAQGASVFAGYFQNEEAAEEFRREAARREVACATIKANLMTPGGVQTLCEQTLEGQQRVDALVYSSATGVHKPLEALTQRHLATVWQVNVGAFFDLSVKLRPSMPSGSKIVAISSEGARRAVNRYGAVGSSKAALESLCRQMAMEWASAGISVNAVSPGLLETDTLSILENAPNRVKQEISFNALKRLVRLQEVAHVVHFLCSPASDGIVGQTIAVDGGKGISAMTSEG
jgi:enoyl-[acyl-carrier protein] reductase III